MQNSEHLSRLNEGVAAWNRWRVSADGDRPVLAQADLSNLDLRKYDLAHVNFFQANLGSANLVDADLSRANLGWADLSGANLSRSNLTGAFLTGTKVYGARFGKTVVAAVDLSAVRGLEAVRHLAKSSIAVDTLELTAAGLSERPVRGHPAAGQPRLRPERPPGIGGAPHPGAASAGEVRDFLRGAGVPERLVETFGLWVQNPAEFFSCFISYNHSDAAFAQKLRDRLQGRGIRCWLDKNEILPGEDILDQVERGIQLWDKVLLCCSEASLNSPWVDREIDKALQKEERLWRERERKILTIIPLNLDGYLFDWRSGKASTLTSRLVADFTGWEQDYAKFEAKFGDLVKALRADQEAWNQPPVAML